MSDLKRELVAIAAHAENRVIGLNGKMPWHYSEDLKHFKSMTTGKVMIMGRLTYDSFRKPLPGRHHIVLTRDQALVGNVITHKDEFETFYVETKEAALAKANELGVEPIVVGGAKIYELFLSEIGVLHLTHIDKEFEGDAFFPEYENEFSRTEIRDSESVDELCYATWRRD